MSQKFCANCNTPLNGDAPFCPNCGAPVQEAPQAAPAPQFIVKQKIPGRGLAIAALVLGILAVVFGASAFITVLDEINEVKELGKEALKALGFGDYLKDEYFGSIIVSAVLGILAICFSSSARSKKIVTGKVKAGLVLGIIGLVGAVGAIVLCAPYIA